MKQAHLIQLNRLAELLREARALLDVPILDTPSGHERNMLTDVHIHIMEARSCTLELLLLNKKLEERAVPKPAQTLTGSPFIDATLEHLGAWKENEDDECIYFPTVHAREQFDKWYVEHSSSGPTPPFPMSVNNRRA